MPCVRGIVKDQSGRILLLKRADTSYGEGSWCLPGGKVDYGETVEGAMRKELEEETELSATDVRFLFYQDSPAARPGEMHCINFYFECQAKGDLKLNSESSEVAWIGREDLAKYEVVFRNDEALLRYWQSRA